jgi:NADP-dependent 3-hydroxy acid dehydrogenase YdfG
MGSIYCNKTTKEARVRLTKSILITGASSGIGDALARLYAADGITLFLSGRNVERLTSLADICESLGATVHSKVIDVTDSAAMAHWIDECNGTSTLDLVIANAGVAGGGPGIGHGLGATRPILAINVDGVVNTVLPALERMRKRGHGQIAVMSSLAAFRGLPASPAYCASKAAVKAWGEGLRVRYAGEGVQICVICPGFVESRMTANNPFPMPFLMHGDRAARIIQRGLARNRGRIAFPRRTYAASWLLDVLPTILTDWMMRNMPVKE